MTEGMSWDELEARDALHGRLAAAVVEVLAEHLPQLTQEEREKAALDVAEVVAYYDDDDRRAGGIEDCVALKRYLRALWELRRAHRALPSRIQEKVAFDADVDLRTEITSLRLLRDMPRYRDKTNMRAVHVVASARSVWMAAHGTPDPSWGALELGGPTTSSTAFADFLAALLQALEIEGARPGDVADPKSAFQAFVRYTGNRVGSGEFPMDDEP